MGWSKGETFPDGETRFALYSSAAEGQRPAVILLRTTNPKSRIVALKTSTENRILNANHASIGISEALLGDLINGDGSAQTTVPIEYRKAGPISGFYYRNGMPRQIWLSLASFVCALAAGIFNHLHNANTSQTSTQHLSLWGFTVVFAGVFLGSLVKLIQKIRRW